MEPENLTYLSRTIIQFYEKLFSWENAVAKNSGLTPQQYHTIEIVGSEGPIRMKPLAEKLGVTTGTLTVMIDRLQKAGYVTRQNDPQDGRAYYSVLTDKGQESYREHQEHHRALVENITGTLADAESAQLITILNKINGLF